MALIRHTNAKHDKRAICYYRYSPRPNKQSDSLIVQEQRCKAYIKFNNLVFYGDVHDPHVSARKTKLADRPGGRRLLDAIASDDIHHVVVASLDRIWRNVIDGSQTALNWQEKGIILHLANEGGVAFNTNTAMGRAIFHIRLATAELEAALNAERTQSGIYSRLARGLRMTTKIRGFDAIKGKLVPNEREQQKYREIVFFAVLGLSMRDISIVAQARYPEVKVSKFNCYDWLRVYDRMYKTRFRWEVRYRPSMPREQLSKYISMVVPDLSQIPFPTLEMLSLGILSRKPLDDDALGKPVDFSFLAALAEHGVQSLSAHPQTPEPPPCQISSESPSPPAVP